MSDGLTLPHYLDLPEHTSSSDVSNSPASDSHSEPSVVGNTTQLFSTSLYSAQSGHEGNNKIMQNVYHTTKVNSNKDDLIYYTSAKANWYKSKKDGKKKDQRRAYYSDNKNFKPHFGIEQLSSLNEQLEDLASFAGVDLSDDLVRKIEGIVALAINLRECTTYAHFTSSVFLYMRDFYDSSITKQTLDYVHEIFASGDFEVQSNADRPAWLDLVRDVHDNWTLCKGNKAFKQFSKLMAILVTLGLCDASSLTFDVQGFKLFDEEILKRHMSAYDLADAVLGTITYFVEGSYLCFKTKSFKPLLLNDFSALELDSQYVNVFMWWDLVKNGNLERVIGMSDAEFESKLRSLILQLGNLMSQLSGMDKKIISDKLTKMKLISNELITLKISSGTRRSPFAIELFGDSNQGKTTFGDQLLDALMISNDLPVDKKFRAALNPGDKFFSNWTSDKLVAILDDLANEKGDFVERPPTRAIIDICNNQMYYAPKAELEAKGKCFVEPEIVLVTTNKKDLDAYVYSNCPFSIQRRMDLVFTVTCKPAFQRMLEGRPCGVDSTKVREYYTIDGEYTPPAIDDIWTITIEQAVKPNKLSEVAPYYPITWNGKLMVNVSSIEAIQCAIEYMGIHRLNQKSIITHMKMRTKTMSKCTFEGCNQLQGFCHLHKFEQQFGLQTALALEHTRSALMRRATIDTDSILCRVENVVTKKVYSTTSNFLAKWDWICLVPSEVLEDPRFLDVAHWYYKDEIESQSAQFTKLTICICLLACYFHWQLGVFAFFSFLLFGTVFKKSMTKQTLLTELKKRNDSIPLVIKNTRDQYAKALCYGSAGIATLYAISRIYKAWKSIQSSQGSLEPKTPEEVKARDEEKNVWAAVQKRDLPTTEHSKTSTIERLTKSVTNNLLYASINNGTDTLMANILMLKSDIMLLPDHYFKDVETLEVKCFKENADSMGGSFATRLCLSSSCKLAGTDLRICYTGSGGSYRDLTRFLPIGDISNHPFNMLWRKKSGELINAKGLACAKTTTNGTVMFKGGDYANLTIDTFGGLCGAVLISDTNAPAITGFHLGGESGTPFGCFGTLTQDQVLGAIREITSIEGTLITGSAEKFVPQAFGTVMTTDAPLHPKSPLNYLPEGSQFAYHGSCIGASMSKSDVRQTPISEAVAEVTGIENTWGPPKMKPAWFGWQNCLANASAPGSPFPHSLLEAAVVDYKRPLLELAALDMWQAQPLSDHDNLCGIPGCKFIDAINLNTSIGYPLTGAKRKFVTELPPTKDRPNNREFTPEVMEEIERVEECYMLGQRAFTIAKACKKDEVLPRAKEKCRIFYGNPIALTFLVRKYYLPVLRFLQMNPLKSECAVGINAHGPEWDQFYKHTMAFGNKTMFGGDYGKYDQKLPSQLLKAALRILIDLAREMGYGEEDLAIMSAMAGDIVYSLVAVNGDLIGLICGTHISGNSLTVILNGICGCLNLRMFFYTRYDKSIHFQDASHMSTYGDDNNGTVHPDYPEFNIKACSEFLASYGQVYTMPDKTSELTPYLKEDEFEFLKRFNVYHPKLDCNVGALLETSIFKSLHCYMRPKGCVLTPHEACAQNIDGALREWFNHGKDTYETRRADMKLVADKVEISHMCSMLDRTYEEGVADWYQKYRGAAVEEARPNNFTVQSGHETSQFEEIEALMPIKCVRRNCVAFDPTFGEVDLIFETLMEGRRHLVLVEVKSSPHRLPAARQQVKKYFDVMRILQPTACIFAMVVDPAGWHPVCITEGPLTGWFRITDNDEDTVFRDCILLGILES